MKFFILNCREQWLYCFLGAEKVKETK